MHSLDEEPPPLALLDGGTDVGAGREAVGPPERANAEGPGHRGRAAGRQRDERRGVTASVDGAPAGVARRVLHRAPRRVQVVADELGVSLIGRSTERHATWREASPAPTAGFLANHHHPALAPTGNRAIQRISAWHGCCLGPGHVWQRPLHHRGASHVGLVEGHSMVVGIHRHRGDRDRAWRVRWGRPPR